MRSFAPNETAIWESLDAAIANVAGEEYQRLANGKKPSECASAIKGALCSLDKLQKGEMPDYDDEWTTLFYLTWYQPRQVKLGYGILHSLLSNQPLEKPLRVIDYGCGALAAQFALAIYSAIHAPDDSSSPNMSIHGVDPSDTMRKIGDKLWMELWGITEQCSDLKPLYHACDAISSTSCSVGCHHELADTKPSARSWLLAMHVVYEETKDEVRDSLMEICSEHKPERRIMTCQKQFLGLAEYIGGRHSERLCVKRRSGSLSKVTSWRHCLQKCLDGYLSDKSTNYLLQEVKWEPRESAVLHWPPCSPL